MVVEETRTLALVLEEVVLLVIVGLSELVDMEDEAGNQLVEVVIEEEEFGVDKTAALVVLDDRVDEVAGDLEVVCNTALVIELAEAVVVDEYCTKDVVADVIEIDVGTALDVLDTVEDDVTAAVETIDNVEVGALEMSKDCLQK